jgi:hypothetical protein
MYLEERAKAAGRAQRSNVVAGEGTGVVLLARGEALSSKFLYWGWGG